VHVKTPDETVESELGLQEAVSVVTLSLTASGKIPNDCRLRESPPYLAVRGTGDTADAGVYATWQNPFGEREQVGDEKLPSPPVDQ
jgi:hypothetical protein